MSTCQKGRVLSCVRVNGNIGTTRLLSTRTFLLLHEKYYFTSVGPILRSSSSTEPDTAPSSLPRPGTWTNTNASAFIRRPNVSRGSSAAPVHITAYETLRISNNHAQQTPLWRRFQTRTALSRHSVKRSDFSTKLKFNHAFTTMTLVAPSAVSTLHLSCPLWHNTQHHRKGTAGKRNGQSVHRMPQSASYPAQEEHAAQAPLARAYALGKGGFTSESEIDSWGKGACSNISPPAAGREE